MLLPTEKKSKEFIISFCGLCISILLPSDRQTDRLTERQTGRQVKSTFYSKVFWNLRLQSR